MKNEEVKKTIDKKDYEEPCCALNMHPEIKPIPTSRVLEKLDSYLNKRDYAGAERHLDYWLAEAKAGNDQRGELTVRNEQIGLFRKTEQKEKCFAAIDEALSLIEKLSLSGENSVTEGTTLVNAATGCKAFGETARALELYEKARTVYEASLKEDDERLSALYNNMASALCESGRYDEAEKLYFKALAILEKKDDSDLEIAITYLNLADLETAAKGNKANAYIKKAEELLLKNLSRRDGYFAFVCEKCAPAFQNYGYFVTAQKLKKAAREIYAGN